MALLMLCLALPFLFHHPLCQLLITKTFTLLFKKSILPHHRTIRRPRLALAHNPRPWFVETTVVSSVQNKIVARSEERSFHWAARVSKWTATTALGDTWHLRMSPLFHVSVVGPRFWNNPGEVCGLENLLYWRKWRGRERWLGLLGFAVWFCEQKHVPVSGGFYV